MATAIWKTEINFASALLLHSCITVILKEGLNVIEIARRLVLRFWLHRRHGHARPSEAHSQKQDFALSIVLDAYTSIFSHDLEGELAELYFTNTGFVLLALSLASSVAMNLLLSPSLLNAFVATTFGLAFLASLINGDKEIVLPILALRRAGRFIWSDTPFVNFFSLIYIATVLKGSLVLRLQDYVTFRGIAVLELVFMKANLAASRPEKQIRLLRGLVESEWVVLGSKSGVEYYDASLPTAQRDDIVPFTSMQRLAVMLFKTSVGFHLGGLQGPSGPASCLVPEIGTYVEPTGCGWKMYRLSEDVMVLSDCPQESSHRGLLGRITVKAHGILLKQLGKVRVVYLLQISKTETGSVWHSNINLVTGVSRAWLEEQFTLATTEKRGIIT